jgi:hypothetical protein
MLGTQKATPSKKQSFLYTPDFLSICETMKSFGLGSSFHVRQLDQLPLLLVQVIAAVFM